MHFDDKYLMFRVCCVWLSSISCRGHKDFLWFGPLNFPMPRRVVWLLVIYVLEQWKYTNKGWAAVRELLHLFTIWFYLWLREGRAVHFHALRVKSIGERPMLRWPSVWLMRRMSPDAVDMAAMTKHFSWLWLVNHLWLGSTVSDAQMDDPCWEHQRLRNYCKSNVKFLCF